MKNDLASLIGEEFAKDYEIDLESGIYQNKSTTDIDYSDGDDAENRVKEAIEKASDRSLFSEELAAACIDWPSLYHLSPVRANILRPFSSMLKGAKVLEIGSGCGAITRYLGECGAITVALEGTYRRASITKSRTSDLENINVISTNFSDFRTCNKFDIITLIGVLEYASIYSSAEDAVKSMLRKICSMLAHNGRLIIAIENKLGLKYFAGSLEDHLGVPMIGLEGRYRQGGVQTFGLSELKSKVTSAGLTEIEVLLPFPDYKFPSSIITANSLNSTDFDAAAFAWQSVKADPQLKNVPAFSLEAAWREVAKNGLAADLSNSFLLVAKMGFDIHEPRKDSLAWHYSNNRSGKFFKTTTFERHSEGYLDVLISTNEHIYYETDEFIFLPSASQVYYEGEIILYDLIQILIEDQWDLIEVTNFFRKYYDIMTAFIIPTVSKSPASNVVPGSLIDAVPRNLVRTKNDEYKFIDREWCSKKELSFPYMLFRSFITLIGSISLVGAPKDHNLVSWIDLYTKVHNEIFDSNVKDLLDEFIGLELKLVYFTKTRITTEAVMEALKSPLPIRKDLKILLSNDYSSRNQQKSDVNHLEELKAAANDSWIARQVAEATARQSEEARLRAEQIARISEEARLRAEHAAEISEKARIKAEHSYITEAELRKKIEIRSNDSDEYIIMSNDIIRFLLEEDRKSRS